MKARRIREKAGLTREQAAYLSGVSVSTILRLENGIGSLRIDKLLPLADLYRVSVDDLLVRTPRKKRPA